MTTSNNRSLGSKRLRKSSDLNLDHASDVIPVQVSLSTNRSKSASVCLAPKDNSRRRDGMHSIHACFSRELGFDVKVIAANERRTIQSLVGEAIDVILITRGYPARGER